MSSARPFKPPLTGQRGINRFPHSLKRHEPRMAVTACTCEMRPRQPTPAFESQRDSAPQPRRVAELARLPWVTAESSANRKAVVAFSAPMPS